jgi:hypothetical protein
LPEKHGLVPQYDSISFANNDIQFKDKTGINHDKFSFGLKKSLYNFMHGIGFDLPVNEWFDFKVPRTTIGPNYIETANNTDVLPMPKASSKPLWICAQPSVSNFTAKKKGKSIQMTE